MSLLRLTTNGGASHLSQYSLLLRSKSMAGCDEVSGHPQSYKVDTQHADPLRRIYLTTRLLEGPAIRIPSWPQSCTFP